MTEWIYLIVGFMFGAMVGLNWLDSKERKTLEQVDKQVRDDLEIQRNKNEALLQDVAFLRNRIKFLESKQK